MCCCPRVSTKLIQYCAQHHCPQRHSTAHNPSGSSVCQTRHGVLCRRPREAFTPASPPAKHTCMQGSTSSSRSGFSTPPHTPPPTCCCDRLALMPSSFCRSSDSILAPSSVSGSITTVTLDQHTQQHNDSRQCVGQHDEKVNIHAVLHACLCCYCATASCQG